MPAAAGPTTITAPRTPDAGLAQVTVGLAWDYKQYAGEQSAEDRERYSFAEIEARARRAGLWREAEPVAPWEWRRGEGGLKLSATASRPYLQRGWRS